MATYKNYSSRSEENLANLNKKSIASAQQKKNVAIPDPRSVYPTKTPTEKLLDPTNVTYEGAVSQGVFPTKPKTLTATTTTPTTTTSPTTTQTTTTKTYTQGVGTDEDVAGGRDMSGLDAQGNKVYGSYDEINSITDPYERNNALKNYYRSKGIPFNEGDFPSSAEDELTQNLYNQEQEKSYLESTLKSQKERALKDLQQTKDASNLAFSQSREGVTSYARTMAPTVIGEAATKQYYDKTRALDESKRKLDKLMQAQQREWVAGRDDQIQRAKADLAEQQQELQDSMQKGKDDMLKILSLDSEKLANLSDDSIAMLTADNPQFAGLLQSARDGAQEKYFNDKTKTSWDIRKSQLETFNTLAKEGVIMSPQMLGNMSQETGIPINILSDFNTRAQQIMSSTKIDDITKLAELEKINNELTDYSKGLTTNEAKKWDLLDRKLAEGSINQDEYEQLMVGMGLKQEDSKIHQANVVIKQSEAIMKALEAANDGKPRYGTKDYLDYQKAELDIKKAKAELNEKYGGSDTAYVPIKSTNGITSRFENGKLIVDPGKSKLQCGAGVNRTWGLAGAGEGGFGNSYQDKMNLVAERGIESSQVTDIMNQIKPGMAFVMKYGKTGHVGLVTGVNPDGSFSTAEWNLDLKGRGFDDTKTRDLQEVSGFVYPPDGSYETVTGKKDELIFKDMDVGTRSAVLSMRNEVDNMPVVRNFQMVQEGYDFLSSYDPDNTTATDDQAFIYAFAKIMDPGSVVRETEYDTVKKYSQSWADTFKIDAMAVADRKTVLTPEARKKMLATIKTKYESQKKGYNKLRQKYVDNINTVSGKKGVGEALLPSFDTSETAQPQGETDDDLVNLYNNTQSSGAGTTIGNGEEDFFNSL